MHAVPTANAVETKIWQSQNIKLKM